VAITVIIGFVLILGSIALSTIIDGNSFGPLIGPSSALLVLGCAIGASMVASEMSDMKKLPKACIRALKGFTVDYDARITLYMQLAETARREGLLALDAKLADIEDPFIRNGMQMVTDGVAESELRDELATWGRSLDERHATAPGILRRLGTYAPAFGMVGTVIGLVNMLGNLSSPEQLGSGMALALLTTLYGSLFANLIFQPMAERLEAMHEAEMSLLAFDADAICGLQTGINPRALVSHLEALLPPSQRVGYEGRSSSAPAAEAA
jgi:chemotaxis protein MotA